MLQCMQLIRPESPPDGYSVGRPGDTISQDDKECAGHRETSIAEKLNRDCPLQAMLMMGDFPIKLGSLINK